jgi:thiosulfate dehydrogenase [quinone] large subunit
MMNYSKKQLFSLVALRMVIGWHFLYEGMVKVLNPAWTSKAYLLDSGGWFKQIFIEIANRDAVLQTTDLLNAYGLTFIGLVLILGVLGRAAAIAGMVLLALYYLSHPAFPGIEYLFPSDGSYFIVNKTLIEFFALLLLFVFPTDHKVGVCRLIRNNKTEINHE